MIAPLAQTITAPGINPEDNCNIRINYQDADIRAVIEEMVVISRNAILIDPSVNGTITLETPNDFAICPDEAWALFQDLLRQNGFVATPQDDGRYVVVPITIAQRTAGPVGSANTSLERGGVVTRIFRLQNVNAQEAARNIAQITSEGAIATAIRSNNTLLVVDNTSNMKRISDVLADLDRDTRIFRTIKLENASARDVSIVLQGVAQNLSDENGSISTQISIVPIDASNSILVRAEPQMISNLVSVVEELDLQGVNSSEVSVIPLRHGNAEEIVTVLRETTTPSHSGSASGAGTPISINSATGGVITAYGPTNAIIIKGDTAFRREVQKIVEQLDIRRAQVLVEAIIVDISDTTAREIGVQYFLSGTGNSNSTVPFSAVMQIALRQDLVMYCKQLLLAPCWVFPVLALAALALLEGRTVTVTFLPRY